MHSIHHTPRMSLNTGYILAVEIPHWPDRVANFYVLLYKEERVSNLPKVSLLVSASQHSHPTTRLTRLPPWTPSRGTPLLGPATTKSRMKSHLSLKTTQKQVGVHVYTQKTVKRQTQYKCLKSVCFWAWRRTERRILYTSTEFEFICLQISSIIL